MLETLVAPRIRRTLFEYVLSHSRERFYLRGLAKKLDLPISPLRRELKRLEQRGMLSCAQEGNILFYTINTTSPSFVQLRHAGEPIEASSLAASEERIRSAPAPAIVGGGPGEFGMRSEVVPDSPFPIPHSALPVGPEPSLWRGPLRGPVLVTAAGVGMVLMLMIATLGYLTLTHQQGGSLVQRLTTAVKATMSSTASSSSVMHGSRWQIVPGGFGGFSAGASNERR